MRSGIRLYKIVTLNASVKNPSEMSANDTCKSKLIQ